MRSPLSSVRLPDCDAPPPVQHTRPRPFIFGVFTFIHPPRPHPASCVPSSFSLHPPPDDAWAKTGAMSTLNSCTA